MVSRRQIINAIEILSQATEENFLDLKKEIESSVTIAKNILNESEKKIKALSIDQGISQSLFGFTVEYVKKLKPIHSTAVENFIFNWCSRQSDWRFPWCWICPNHLKYLEFAVKSHLVYVCANGVTEKEIKQSVNNALKKSETANPHMFRIKPLEFTGHIRDQDVPHKQIGTFISLDFLPYLSLEQIQNVFNSINDLLKEGGQALVHFSDGDGELEWQSVIDHKITYCNQQIIKEMADKLNLQSSFYHIDDFYSFVVITKPGNKTSIKTGMTKIEPIVSTK